MSENDYTTLKTDATGALKLPLDMERMRPDVWFGIDPHKIPHDEVISGFPVGSVGAFNASGGSGKSYAAMELGISVACPEADIAGFGPRTAGLVALINAEDGYFELARRLAYIGQRIPPELWDEAGGNFCLARARGRLIDLGTRPLDDAPVESDVEALAECFVGYRLIILDTLTRFHTLDENSNGQMGQLISILEYLAEKTGAAVLFLHHANKAAIREGSTDSQAAGRGASALTDNVRWSAYLSGMTADEAKELGVAPGNRGRYVRFGVSKLNHGLRPEDRWLERKEGGVLVPAKLPGVAPSIDSVVGDIQADAMRGKREKNVRFKVV